MDAAVQPLLAIDGLKAHFRNRDGTVRAVDDVSFDVYPGETLALVGESGCGKSVTALSILRLIPTPPARVAGGTITFAGRDLAGLSDEAMRAVRGNEISMIFQEPMTSLNPVLTVGQQIAEALVLHRGLSKADAMQQAERIRTESSRYNIGNVTRDINVPTFALHYLLPEVRGRSVFRVKGTERIGGVDATVVEFDERATPTLVVGRDYENVPGRGRIWIEPGSGIILQAQLETRPSGMTTRSVVTYQREARLGLWVPARMDEKHSFDRESVEGLATYTNFRSFRVETTVDIK